MTDDELSGHDLQRSPEQDPERHRRTSALLQDAVATVVASHTGATEDEATAALETALAERGLAPQPERWVEAVVTAAVAGNVYVVDEQALRDTGTDVPEMDQMQHPETHPVPETES